MTANTEAFTPEGTLLCADGCGRPALKDAFLCQQHAPEIEAKAERPRQASLPLEMAA